jgi:TolA-binding protein
MSNCERSWELQVYREGRLGPKDVKSFERHLQACRECKLRNEREERLRVLGGAIGQDDPGELTMRRLRARVLRDVATGAAPREPRAWTRIAVAASLALTVGGASVWLAHGGSHPKVAAPAAVATTVPIPANVDALAGTITATPGARWTQARQDGVERVTLDDGTLEIHVRAQRFGELFLVVMPDGELEVRGTTFEITVAGGLTTRVQVDEGMIELRLRGRDVVRLERGDVWTPPAPVTANVPVKASAPRPAPSVSTDNAIAATSPDDGASGYTAAVELLRAGRGDDAAAAFHAFLLAHPAASQAEDASYLEAVSLARAGRTDAAGLAAEHHLARYPASFHRKEAAILVARAADQRGDCSKARAVLAPWLGSPDAEVRAAVASCPEP